MTILDFFDSVELNTIFIVKAFMDVSNDDINCSGFYVCSRLFNKIRSHVNESHSENTATFYYNS